VTTLDAPKRNYDFKKNTEEIIKFSFIWFNNWKRIKNGESRESFSI